MALSVACVEQLSTPGWAPSLCKHEILSSTLHARSCTQGGGLCELDNLRTLCVACHADVTKVRVFRVKGHLAHAICYCSNATQMLLKCCSNGTLMLLLKCCCGNAAKNATAQMSLIKCYLSAAQMLMSKCYSNAPQMVLLAGPAEGADG
jgi:hypothetical protein